MSERDHGWPEGYGWTDYLQGQMELTKTNRAEEILCDEIAILEDREEQRRALLAWKELEVQGTGRVGDVLRLLEANLLSL